MKKEYIFIFYGVIAIIVIVFLTAILKKLGIFKSKEKKEQIQNIVELQTADYFNPQYYKTIKIKPLGESLAGQLAKEIRKAVRGSGTDENLIYSVFNRIYNKANISEIAEQYYLEYKKDMKTDILNDLGNKEKSMMMEIINSKPERT